MKYRDRLGNEYEHTTEQDRFLADAYESVVGRALMKFLCNPVFSKVGRIVLESELSAKAVKWFADKNNIDMSEYEDKEYVSFNDFFTRKIKADKRFVTKDDNILISPSDGKVSAYRITADSRFTVKNSVYSVASLLRDSKLAKRYEGGTALIIRLSVDDYHRYCYPCNGIKSHNRSINGMLHTVNPVVSEYIPVYKENSREYTMIRSDNFGDVIQMEVGALLVGKITNAHKDVCRVTRGEEKGYFEFGGSTIILLLEQDKVNVSADLFENTKEDFETKVKQGEALGEANV